MKPTLDDVRERLDGAVVQPRFNQLRTNVCPACGGHRERYRKCFSVTENEYGVAAYCHKCRVSPEEIAAAVSEKLGLEIAPYFFREERPDPGPYHARDEVLGRIRAGQFQVVPTDFGCDETGRLTRWYVEHNYHARRRDRRLRFDAHLMPASEEYVIDAFRRGGIRIGKEKAAAIRERLSATVSWNEHDYTGVVREWVVEATGELHQEKGRRTMRVFDVTRAQDADADADASRFTGSESDPNPDAEQHPSVELDPPSTITHCLAPESGAGERESVLDRFFETPKRAHAPPPGVAGTAEVDPDGTGDDVALHWLRRNLSRWA